MNVNPDFIPEPPPDGTPTKNGRGAVELPPPAPEPKTLSREQFADILRGRGFYVATQAAPSTGDLPLEEQKRLKMSHFLSEAIEHLEFFKNKPDKTQGIIDDLAKRVGRFVTKEDSGLPPIKKLGDYVTTPPATPPLLIDGILHQGSKMVLGGGSKSFKTWSLIDLGLSVATGEKWWGFQTVKKKVLYVNMEIQEGFFIERIKEVCTGKIITSLPEDEFHIWNLRGFATNLDKLLPQILASVKEDGFGLIIIDPIYKLYGDRDENAAGDVASLMNGLEKIAVESGAAIVFGAHFAKGNSSAKDAIDLVAGSGVFARDPDSLIYLRQHQEDDCYTCQMILRNFKPIESCVLKWKFPLMVRQDKLDPKRLKQVGGSPKQHDAPDLLKYLETPSTLSDWKKATMEDTGMSKSLFYELKKVLEESELVVFDEMNRTYRVKTI